MSRLNLDPLMTFRDGSHLVISAQQSAGGEFSCLWYSTMMENDDRITFKVLSHHFDTSTCLSAQQFAYDDAFRFYPSAATVLKNHPI